MSTKLNSYKTSSNIAMTKVFFDWPSYSIDLHDFTKTDWFLKQKIKVDI